jgi:uncharacterized protein YbjT (DUF2867 family)
VPELLKAGFAVRCMARDPDRLRDYTWAGDVEFVRADVTRPATLPAALEDVDVAYYLIHSLNTGRSFERTEELSALAFANAADNAGAGRIVYLGGMAPASVRTGELSPHLRSRLRVGRILRGSGVPTVELRAAVVIGSGSASFEMLRYLTERLPAMITPKWVDTRIQPIAVRDVLRYLVGAGLAPEAEVGRGGVFDIGGADILTYREMMQRYARISGLPRRLIFPVPVLTPALSSHWVGAVTPVPASIARPLVESLRHEVVCRDHAVARLVPDPPEGLIGFDDAVRLALARVKEANVATRWASAGVPGAPSDPLPTDPDWSGGSLYQDRRRVDVAVDAASVWHAVEAIGGETGWYSFPLAWAVRGWLDRLFGGIGLRRGRRDPENLRLGDTLDFWRVEAIDRGRLLRLRAEMKLPGLAWLEMTVEPAGEGRTVYRQRALFYPRGLSGHLYWWSVAPFHAIVFGGMARNLAQRAVERAATVAADRAGAAAPKPQHPADNAARNTERTPES